MLPLAITIAAGPTATPLLLPGQHDFAVMGLILQPDDGASNPMFIGDASVTTAVYSFRLNAPAGGVPPVPLAIIVPHSSLGLLSQMYVIGTAGEILRGAVIPR